MASKWTRATYKAHAEILEMYMSDANRELITKLAKELAVIYYRDNNNFQRDKFLAACGVKP